MSKEKISGSLARIIYHGNNFLIASTSNGIVVKGTMVCPQVGLNYDFEGQWEEDPQWGKQFKFSFFKAHYPVGAQGTQFYLTKNCPGIGTMTAKKIVEEFGDRTIELLKTNPERVADKISGITTKKAEIISKALKEREDLEVSEPVLRELFDGLGIRQNALTAMLAMWGSEAPGVIKMDPYLMTTCISGVGFPTADAIAERVGFATDGPPRIKSGIRYVMEQAAQGFLPGIGSGHTYLPRNILVESVIELLSVDESLINEQLDAVIEDNELRLVGDRVYLHSVLEDELKIAKVLGQLMESAVLPPTNSVESLKEVTDGLTMDGVSTSDSGLFEDQLDALRQITKSPVFVLCGAAGTGKSYVVRAILQMFEGMTIELATPTGKAAKRLEEITGHEARTIHRLLECFPSESYDTKGRKKIHWVFRRNEMDPINASVIVIDEVSMTDVKLMASLLGAIRPGTRVIFVGDPYQLPSVGPGNVLHDMIRSGSIPTVELQTIKRQDPNKLIVANSRRIRESKDIVVRNLPTSDFFFINESNIDVIVERTVNLVTERLPRAYKLDPFRDIQVICARRDKSEGSAADINARIQSVLNKNPAGDGKIGVGDRVIQTRNDYALNVMNGDQGIVVDVGPTLITIDFESLKGMVEISRKRNDLKLAYAITCHKAQGSQVLAIVIPLHDSFGAMLMQRHWLYTAVTRAQMLCVIVGQRDLVPKISDRAHGLRRYTGLRDFLSDMSVEKCAEEAGKPDNPDPGVEDFAGDWHP